jgi:peptide methionine sulfoxide reductase msrA/msrB
MGLSQNTMTTWRCMLHTPILLCSLFVLTILVNVEAKNKTVYFAGGCFWCMEPVFDAIPGVTNTTVGYMGGKKETANYTHVSSGKTDHIEVIQVIYNPDTVTYGTLLDAFWKSIDPTDPTGQFADKGPHYQTAIFIRTPAQQTEAKASKERILKSFDQPIATLFLEETTFYPAEDYHQDYYQKNTTHYNAYKIGSGRAGFLNRLWNKN